MNGLMALTNKGFSLIELLVALLITSILSVTAYSGYQFLIIKSERTDAKLALLDLACRMELHHTNHNTYKTATIGTGQKTDIMSHSLSPQQHYQISIHDATDDTYTLKATRNLPNRDDACTILMLNQSGTKTAANVSHVKTTAHCW
jgi:type IV pilus assembly protein PilE